MTDSTNIIDTGTNPPSEGAPAVSQPPTVSHFWVGSSEYFETTLFTMPVVSSNPHRAFQSTISIFDPDGALINRLEVECPVSRIGVLEMAPLLGSCKLEAGIRHAHVEVVTEGAAGSVVRFHTKEGAAVAGHPQQVTSSIGAFFPITFSDERRSLISVVNFGETPAQLRCRLFLGTRVPEFTADIPARGARLLSVEGEFDEYVSLLKEPETQGYLRLTTRSEAGLGVQLLEQTRGTKEFGIFNTVS